jgi:hypothetical protein
VGEGGAAVVLQGPEQRIDVEQVGLVEAAAAESNCRSGCSQRK